MSVSDVKNNQCLPVSFMLQAFVKALIDKSVSGTATFCHSKLVVCHHPNETHYIWFVTIELTELHNAVTIQSVAIISAARVKSNTGILPVTMATKLQLILLMFFYWVNQTTVLCNNILLLLRRVTYRARDNQWQVILSPFVLPSSTW